MFCIFYIINVLVRQDKQRQARLCYAMRRGFGFNHESYELYENFR